MIKLLAPKGVHCKNLWRVVNHRELFNWQLQTVTDYLLIILR